MFGFENQTEHKGIRLLYTPQGLQLQVESAGSTLPLQSTAVLLGRWVQVELVVTVGQAGQVTAYVDGNLAADATLNTEVTDGYVHLVLGTVKTQGPVILYADDFLLQRAVPARP